MSRQSGRLEKEISVTCNLTFIYLQGTPLLILANKQDLPMAKEPKELEKLLGLHELLSPIALSVSSGTLSSIDGSLLPDKGLASSSSSLVTSKNTDQNQPKSWHIQPTCAITGEGSYEETLKDFFRFFKIKFYFSFQVFTRV